MNRVFHIRLLVTLLVAGGAASSCVKLTGIHDGCVVTADCNPGRQCVAGVCQVNVNLDRDASIIDTANSVPEVASDVPPTGDGSVSETKPETGPDVHDVLLPEAGPTFDVREDLPDGAHDVPVNQDAFDSGPEGPVDAADARDGNDAGDVPPDNGPAQPAGCDLPATVQPAPASASLPRDVAGTWQVCGDVSGASADILWLLGGTKTIYLDGKLYWGRVAAGTAFQGNQDGMYFQVLEGTHSILQFVDISLATGGGATLAANYFPSQGVLDFMSCDGAVLCGPSVVRLVRLGGDAGQ